LDCSWWTRTYFKESHIRMTLEWKGSPLAVHLTLHRPMDGNMMPHLEVWLVNINIILARYFFVKAIHPPSLLRLREDVLVHMPPAKERWGRRPHN